MSGNLDGFDASKVEPTDSACLPIGDYRMIVIESKIEDKESGAQMLDLTCQILGGQYQNRRVWHSECLKQKDGTKNQAGLGKLSALCRAVGKLTPRDTTELHNIPFVGTVGIKKSEGYNPKNNVTRFAPAKDGEPTPPAASPAPSTGGSGTPWV